MRSGGLVTKCLVRLVVDLSKAGQPAPQTKAAQTQKHISFCTGFRTALGAPKVLKVHSARPTWMRNPFILEWFFFCAGLRLWCWPPCFGQIDDESNETFCDQNPRTQKLIISKPRGQKPQSQTDGRLEIVVLTLRFLATRLYDN